MFFTSSRKNPSFDKWDEDKAQYFMWMWKWHVLGRPTLSWAEHCVNTGPWVIELKRPPNSQKYCQLIILLLLEAPSVRHAPDSCILHHNLVLRPCSLRFALWALCQEWAFKSIGPACIWLVSLTDWWAFLHNRIPKGPRFQGLTANHNCRGDAQRSWAPMPVTCGPFW